MFLCCNLSTLFLIHFANRLNGFLSEEKIKGFDPQLTTAKNGDSVTKLSSL